MTAVKCRSLLYILGVSFLLLIPCDCLQFQLASACFNQRTGNKKVQVSAEKKLPRMLLVQTGKVTVAVQEYAEKDSPSKNYNQEKTTLPDKLKQQKKGSAAAAKPRPGPGQTWHQWMADGGESSEFFTMDYSRVRRRRPIHNKSLPVGP